MNSRFKSNNLFAGLIALVLIAIGFALSFYNQKSQPIEEPAIAETTAVESDAEGIFTEVTPASEKSLSRIALIHTSHDAPSLDKPEKTELELIRDSIDWSDAPSPKPELIKTDDYDVYINVTKEYLMYIFDKMGYTGDKIDSGETEAIPPLLVVSISKGWSDNETVQFKKSIFYRVILTLILYENEAVLREREKLLAILDTRGDDGTFPADQVKRLNALAFNYRVIKAESGDTLTDDQIQELLIRVDMVPPSLALAQAAHESGYATSRFAHSANALFGQWDWSADAVKPQQQRKGMGNYGIKSFDQPIDSVRAYIWNLNTHRAYADFRTVRAAQRGEQQGRITLDSKKLAGTLTSYSERGTEYTEELKSTISYNRLDRADHLRLIEGEPIYFH
jgi:Bax protein